MSIRAHRARVSRPVYVLIVAVQFLLLSAAVASIYVHSTLAIREFVTPRLSDAYLITGTFLLAGLLGMSVGTVRLTIVLCFLLCLVAAIMYGAVLYSPGWYGIYAQSVALQNFILQSAIFAAGWTFLPACTGGVIGHFLGAGMRRAMLGEPEGFALWAEAAPKADPSTMAPEPGSRTE